MTDTLTESSLATATFSNSVFEKQFGLSKGNDKDGKAVKFSSQDSNYRIYIPDADKGKSTTTKNSDGSLTLVLAHDHIRGASSDDHSNATLVFKSTGALASVAQAFDIEDGKPFTIPGWVPAALDIGVEALGALGALETAGISELGAQIAVADITAFCVSFNKISTGIAKWSDDGGRLNFPAVICHDMNRACVAVSGSDSQAVPTEVPAFNADAFGKAMGTEKGIKDVKTNKTDWSYSASDHGWNYKTWKHDVTVGRSAAAILVSCKIDHKDSPKDQHVVLLAAFNRACNFIAAQAAFQDVRKGQIDSTDVVRAATTDSDPNATVIKKVTDQLASKIKAIEGKDGDDIKYLSDVAAINLRSMQKAVGLTRA